MSVLLRDRVTVQNATRTPTETGGWSETWADAGVVNGRGPIIAERDRFERIRADMPSSVQLAEFLLDGYADVTVSAGSRLVASDGSTWEVVQFDQQAAVMFVIGRRV